MMIDSQNPEEMNTNETSSDLNLQNNEEEKKPETVRAEDAPEEAEYEFSSDSTEPTPVEASDGGAFFASSGAYTGTVQIEKQKKKKEKKGGKGVSIAVLAVAIVLSILFGAVSGALSAKLIGRDKAPLDNGRTSGTVKTDSTVKVNEATVDAGAYASAAAEAVDTVVSINIYQSEKDAAANESIGAGSGVIFSKEGYILTCNHVVEGAAVVRVTLSNGNTCPAEVIGKDSQTDVAVIKITADGLHACAVRDWKNQPLVLGESVLAIGNPLGVLGNTVTEGIVSSLARDITVEGQAMTLLQTSAAINSGNSGGGLFDINGSLIGIVNAKSTGISVEGIGFAIPIDTAYTIAEELIEHGYVTGRPGLNIQIVNVTQSNYQSVLEKYPQLEPYVIKSKSRGYFAYNYEINTGVFILDASGTVYPEGATEKLQLGDIIKQVETKDGKITEILVSTDLSSLIQTLSIGDTLTMTIYRGGRYITVVAVLSEKTA